LLNSSSKTSYDPLLDIDWDAPVEDLQKAYLPFERVSLYGTELWDQLTKEQRVELSKHELASIAGTGLWFEIILIQMLARYAYHQDPLASHTHYALTEIGDETRHVIMFAKALSRMGLPAYRPPALVHHLAIGRNVPFAELVSWLCSLGARAVVEFTDRDDPMVSRLLAAKRTEVHEGYGREAFEQALREGFEVERREELGSGTRTLYLATPRT
jgi:hypothetical protein